MNSIKFYLHLNFIAVLVVIDLHDLNIFRLDVVFLQDLLGLVTEGAVALRNDKDWLLADLLLDLIQTFFWHDVE